MPEQSLEKRTVTVLSRGSRASIVVALLFVVASAYLLFVPLDVPTQTGVPFRCGTALSPSQGALATSVCQGLVRKQQLLTGSMGAAALVLTVGGIWTFGATRRVQRHVRDDADDDLFAGSPRSGGA